MQGWARVLGVPLGLAAAAFSLGVAAQAYPVKPIRVIFPYPGGSVPDSLGRQVSQGVSEILGQPLVFENRAGANGIIEIGRAHV